MITLQDAKRYLDVIHNADDEKLAQLLMAAEDEALQFMDRENFDDIESDSSSESPSEPDVTPASVQLGILILLEAAYQATPAEAAELRRIAEIKLMPYRLNLGV